MSQEAQILHNAIKEVLALRTGIQQLTQIPIELQNGAPSDAAATLIQDVSAQVQQLGSSWDQVSQAIATLSAANAKSVLRTSTDQDDNSSWWQGPLQHQLHQELLKQYHTLPPLPPLSQPSTSQTYGSDALKGALHRVRTLCPWAMLHICSSTGAFGISTRDAAEVRLGCPPVFCAGIVLAHTGSPEPLRVTVDAISQAATLDPWSLSPHHVFRAVSATAMCALTYFQQSAACRAVLESKPDTVPQAKASKAGAEALENLLLWLLSYRNLFTQPCAVDGQLLVMEPTSQSPMPPIFRPYRLPRDILIAQAVKGSDRAMHMHNVPIEEEGEH